MQKRLLLVLSCVGLMIVGCATHQTAAPTYSANTAKKSARTPANATQIKDAYMTLAVLLAKQRGIEVCGEVEAMQTDILDALRQAFYIDNNVVKNFSGDGLTDFEREVGSTIAYKVMRAGDFSLDRGNFSKVFPGTKFESVGMGAYGHMFEWEFQPSGRVIVREKEIDLDSGDVRWLESVGTWTDLGYKNAHHGNVISVVHNILSGPQKGKQKTNTYVVRASCNGVACTYGLVPSGKAKTKGYNIEFMEYRAFDTADECSA